MGSLKTALICFALFLGLTGCASITLDKTKTGKLKGELAVIWVGEDRFVYVGGTNGLSFTTSDNITIKPEAFYTDGGSIPRPVRALEGFSPWGYAPAYIIHDWLFHMRDCNPDYLTKKQIDFVVANRIMAEVINTLMKEKKVQQNEAAFSSISWAVTIPFVRDVWEKPSSTCVIAPEDRPKVQTARTASMTERATVSLWASPSTTARGRGGALIFRRVYGR
ncbi:MAG: DUF1353 domain-containing protein [Rhabdaerophilum sp.]